MTYCAYCGSHLDGTERFCGNCGNSTAPSSEISAKDKVMAYHPDTGISTAPVSTSWTYEPSRMAFHQAEADRYRASLRNCTIAGIVLAVLASGSIVNLSPYGTTGIFLACAALASAFFAPFGFAPMFHWSRTHSFFVIFNWVIILCALALAAAIAVIAGPFYIYHALSKIKEHERLAALS